MQFHVGRAGNPLGQYTLEELKDGVLNGLFQPTDLVWTEGMSGWKTIREALPEILQAPPGIPLMPQEAASQPTLPPPSHTFVNTNYQGAKLPTVALASTSMWLGITSLFACCCGPLILIPSLVAVITGHMALKEIKNSQGTKGGQGPAIAGLVMGYLCLILGLLFVFSDDTNVDIDWSNGENPFIEFNMEPNSGDSEDAKANDDAAERLNDEAI